MSHYEYAVEDVLPNVLPVVLTGKLNLYGFTGWRLVSVQGSRYVFERAIPMSASITVNEG